MAEPNGNYSPVPKVPVPPNPTSKTMERKGVMKTSRFDIRLTIHQVPSDEVIKQAMKCRICDSSIAPPHWQCRFGHLLCGNHFVKARPRNVGGDGKEQKRQYSYCTVVKSNGGICDGIIFKANSDLFNALYNGCLVSCPSQKLGCREKLSPDQMSKHAMECMFTQKKSCPNEYCRSAPIPATNLVDHLINEDDIPIFLMQEGISTIIPIINEMQKGGIEMPVSKSFQWIAAVLQFKKLRFVVIVRMEMLLVKVWVQEVLDAQHEDCNDSDEDSGYVNGNVFETQLFSRFTMNNKKGLTNGSIAKVASYSKTNKQILHHGDCFTVSRSLLRKYTRNDLAYDSWNLGIGIEEREVMKNEVK